MNVCIAFGSRIVLINKPGTQKASQQPKPKHMHIIKSNTTRAIYWEGISLQSEGASAGVQAA